MEFYERFSVVCRGKADSIVRPTKSSYLTRMALGSGNGTKMVEQNSDVSGAVSGAVISSGESDDAKR